MSYKGSSPFQIVSPDNSWIKVDKEDEELLEVKWSNSHGYAKRYFEASIDGKRVRWVIYLHRAIMGAKEGDVVDHINGDTSDNRRANLRIVNKSVNALNTSSRSGAYKSGNYWYSRITVNGLTSIIGSHKTKEEAEQAYNKRKQEIINEL